MSEQIVWDICLTAPLDVVDVRAASGAACDCMSATTVPHSRHFRIAGMSWLSHVGQVLGAEVSDRSMIRPVFRVQNRERPRIQA